MQLAGYRGLGLSLVLAGASLACAAKQQIALDCLPKEVDIYVDGERIHEMPATIDLRNDAPHTLYFKGPDFAPELVVLNVEEVDGERRLTPDRVCVAPRYLEVRRELEIAIDPESPAEPPSDGRAPRRPIDVAPRPDFVPENP